MGRNFWHQCSGLLHSIFFLCVLRLTRSLFVVLLYMHFFPPLMRNSLSDSSTHVHALDGGAPLGMISLRRCLVLLLLPDGILARVFFIVDNFPGDVRHPLIQTFFLTMAVYCGEKLCTSIFQVFHIHFADAKDSLV